LQSLRDQVVAGVTFEVIVVDDGSTDDTAGFLEKLARSWQLLLWIRQDNAGPTVARNVGVTRARGRILAFTDSDCRPREDWVSRMVEAWDRNPDLVAVEGRTVSEPAKITPFTHQVENLSGGLFCTCNMAYQADALRRLGGFDEDFFYGHEDTELAVRVARTGRTMFEPEMVVLHPAIPQSFRRRVNQVLITIDNEVLLYAKTREWYQESHGCGPIWTVLVRYGLLGPVFAWRQHREYLLRHPLEAFGFFVSLAVLRLWLLVLVPRLLWGVATSNRWSRPRTPFNPVRSSSRSPGP